MELVPGERYKTFMFPNGCVPVPPLIQNQVYRFQTRSSLLSCDGRHPEYRHLHDKSVILSRLVIYQSSYPSILAVFLDSTLCFTIIRYLYWRGYWMKTSIAFLFRCTFILVGNIKILYYQLSREKFEPEPDSKLGPPDF